MGKILVVANWKANVMDVNEWTKQIAVRVQGSEKNTTVEIAIAAPYTLLHFLNQTLSANRYPLTASLSSQDLSAFPPGAYTGEVSAQILANLGVKYALVGHSERRKYLKETNVEVEAKLSQAIANNIVPIICAQTLEEIPDNIRNYDPSKYLVMYEPSFAISTNGQYHPDSIKNITTTLANWKNKLPQNIRFLYGGSISPENVSAFLPLCLSASLSGFVVGHASLDPKSFSDIILALCSLPA